MIWHPFRDGRQAAIFAAVAAPLILAIWLRNVIGTSPGVRFVLIVAPLVLWLLHRNAPRATVVHYAVRPMTWIPQKAAVVLSFGL